MTINYNKVPLQTTIPEQWPTTDYRIFLRLKVVTEHVQPTGTWRFAAVILDQHSCQMRRLALLFFLVSTAVAQNATSDPDPCAKAPAGAAKIMCQQIHRWDDKARVRFYLLYCIFGLFSIYLANLGKNRCLVTIRSWIFRAKGQRTFNDVIWLLYSCDQFSDTSLRKRCFTWTKWTWSNIIVFRKPLTKRR